MTIDRLGYGGACGFIFFQAKADGFSVLGGTFLSDSWAKIV